ncbi:PA domain-containing protein, partial [Lacticaseibacillus rhamnosus]|uniref:PA domain-containing protein n=1 Tax=Lacticaseibacillus rhamnosus TaxID=47715 RepID=UPI0030EEB6AB
VISAGNSGVSTSTGSGNPDQQFDSDELSTVGAPGISPEALTVASSENEKVVSPTMRDASGNVKFDSIADLTDGSTVINQQETDYAQMTGEHKVVSVGTGSEDEYDGKDVKGQIALVKRGAITFSEKANNAKAHGAVGVIIYNNVGTDLIRWRLTTRRSQRSEHLLPMAKSLKKRLRPARRSI